MAKFDLDTDVYWQCTKTCSNERLEHLKSTNAFSDVTFTFPDGEIKAHCNILAMTSPVFAKMLFGNFGAEGERIKNKIVQVADVEMGTFNQLLDYVYCGKFQAAAVPDVIKLHQAADMYLIDHLSKLCIDHLVNNTSVATALHILDYAILISSDNLRHWSLLLVVNNASTILTSDSFKVVRLATVKVVLDKCRIHVPETQLFTLLLDWSEHCLQTQKAENGGEDQPEKTLFSIWQEYELYSLISFGLIPAKEFAQCDRVKSIFNDDECFDILRFLLGCNNVLPPWLGAGDDVPNLDQSIKYISLNVNKSAYQHKRRYTATITFKSSRNVQLLGFSGNLDAKLKVLHTVNDGESTAVFRGQSGELGNDKSLRYLFNKVIQYTACEEHKFEFIFCSGPGNEVKIAPDCHQCVSAPFTLGNYVKKYGMHFVSGRATGFAPTDMRLVYKFA